MKKINAYTEASVARCERALLTLVGDLGPWGRRIYLVGGLAPRYIVGELPSGVQPHVGTTDVDLVIGLALGDDAPETYSTLQGNLTKSGFRQQAKSYQWARAVDGVRVLIELLCETDEVEPGKIHKPKGEGVGSKVGAFNVRGAQLLVDDHVEHDLEGERLDDGGLSTVTIRVAGVLSFVALKVFAFQERHENKDSYDLVFTLLNHADGPAGAAVVASGSPVIGRPLIEESLALLADRYATVDHDGPVAYAAFLDPPDDEERDRLRQEAVTVVRSFLRAL